MSMKMMNAAYLVDNAALLSLQEKQDLSLIHISTIRAMTSIATIWQRLVTIPMSLHLC